MSSNNNVNRAISQAFKSFFGILCAGESRQCTNLDGERRIPFSKRGQMLLHEQGGWYENGNLFSILHCFEGCPDGDFGLAIADIAADQPVHGDSTFHIPLDFIDRAELIGCFDVLEGIFEFMLPWRVRSKCIALRRLACCIESNEFASNLFNGFAGMTFGFLPISTSQAMHARCFTTDITCDQIQLVHGNEQSVRWLTAFARGIFNNQIFSLSTRDCPCDHFNIAANTMVLVNNKIARFESEWVDRAAPLAGHATHVLGARLLANQVALCHNDH